MKKLTTGVVAVALLTAATAGPAWGGWGVNTNFNTNYNRQDNRRDSRDQSDRRVTNTSDSRDMSNRQSWSDSRNMSDNRDQSDRRVDSRNQSTNTTTSTANSHNTTNNQQDNRGDRSGGALFKEKVNVRAGHDTVNFGTVSGGTGNVMDASVNGNTFVIGSGSN
ncbi:MAG: hypothetical protein HY542_05395 [Deltaproteobacteria bacterium]|nr:hypothetical protein [Deltaproteobacteria bacterium]